MSSPQNMDGDEIVDLRFMDESSGLVGVTVRIGYTELMRALLNKGSQPCRIDYRDLDLIGKVRETKIVSVKDIPELVLNQQRQRTPEITKFLAQYEVDGWQANISDLYNPHRGSNTSRSVGFVRYVDGAQDV